MLAIAVTTLLLGGAAGYFLRTGGAAAAGGGPPGPPTGPPSGGAKAPSMLVRVGSVEREPIKPIRKLVGDLISVHNSTVAAEVAGKISELLVDEGSKVEAGKTLLARIDGTWIDLEIERTESQIQETKVNLAYGHSELKRLQQLTAKQAVAISELDAQQATVDALEASLTGLISTLDEVKERKKRLDIYAPFDGTVVAKHTEVGEYVVAGSSIVDIVSSGRIDAKAMVPEQSLPLIKLGDSIDVLIDSLGLELKGTVASINPNGSVGSRTFPVRLSLDDQGGKLMPGMGVTVFVPATAESTELIVPRDAVLIKPDEATVWILQADTTAQESTDGKPPATTYPKVHPVPVHVLSHTRDYYAITCVRQADAELVKPGVDVVIEGLERLVPNMAVRVDPNRSALSAVPGSYRNGQQVVDRVAP